MRDPTDSTFFVGRERWTLVVVFMLAAIGLAYEVVLTRLFSLMFQYHYVFLIVSVSVAGLGMGAALATVLLRRRPPEALWPDLVHVALLTVLLLVGSSVVLSQLRSSERTTIAVAAAALPFVGIGCLNAVLFARFAAFGGVIYAADLLGASAGLIAALGLVAALGAFDAVLLLALLMGGIALLLALVGRARGLQVGTAGVAALVIAAIMLNGVTGWIGFDPDRLEHAPPDKTMLTFLKVEPSATITETRWGAFARIDVVATDDSAVQYVFTDGGAGSTMVRYTGDDRRVSWLKREIAYVPFAVEPEQTRDVLILGAGAGKDVLMARLAGAESIVAVEINPTLVDLTRDYAEYNGGIFDLPDVETVVADGRNYVERSDRRFDLIYANIVYSQAAAPGTSALAESYIFTREALTGYWERLSDNGRIGFVTHHGIEGLRLLVGALDMLERQGMTLQEALQHVALLTLQADDPQTRTAVVLVARQPWTPERAALVAEAAHQRSGGALYLPGYQELGLEGLVSGLMTLDEFIAQNADEFNFEPTTDDQPFFYQFRPGLPEQVSDLLLISLILNGVYLSWAMFFHVREREHWKRFSLVPYFALLGAAFMLVEIPLIQRFNLLIGQPNLTLVVVIGALLAGGGLGSLSSSRLGVTALPRWGAVIPAVIGVMVILSRGVYPALIDWALPWETLPRVLVTLAALFPLGFLMGMPFPGGLRLSHRVDPEGIAAYWGANALASVLGSALAMALAVNGGFSAALTLGAVLYGGVAVLVAVAWPRLLA